MNFRLPGMQMRMIDKEDELALFLEMRKIENQRDSVFLHNSDEFDASLGTKGSSPIYDIAASLAPALKTVSDEFLNSEGDKNDYEWLLSPPGTPLFPSLEMESQNTVTSQTGIPEAHTTASKSRLADVQLESTASKLTSREPVSSPGLNMSSGGVRRPSSSGGTGTISATPTRRPTLNPASKPVLTSAPKPSSTATSKPSVGYTSKPSRSSTPTSHATLASTKPTVPARSSTPTRSTVRSSTPTARSTARSSTPTARSTARSSTTTASSTARSSTPTPSSTARTSTPSSAARTSTPSSTARTSTPSSTARTSTPSSTARISTPASSTARSSTPTGRSTAKFSTLPARTSSSLPASKPTSRATTPIRRPTTLSTASDSSSPPVKSPLFPKVATATSKYPVPPRVSSPIVKPRPWKPSEMPGFSLDAPPNLRTSLSERPISATRGKPGLQSNRSSSVEPAPNGRIRRQSCSPSRGRPPNGINVNSRSSVPALSRAYANANDNVSPVMYGTKMVERVMNMRKLVPPRQDDKHSPLSNLSGKSSSPDSSGFGRSLSKKSLDMAMRHMDIRRSIPGNLRPLMANIPASSMYSVRSGPAPRSRIVGVSDSPVATSSNASSEVSVNNNALCLDRSEIEDDINSESGVPPASVLGR